MVWRWKQEQKDFRKGVEKEMMQKKIQIPMSLVFMKECMQALLDFLYSTNVGRVSGPEEEAERSESEGLSSEGE